MRLRTVSLSFDISALMLSGLIACNGVDPQAPLGQPAVNAESEAVQEKSAASSPELPAAVDIRVVELRSIEWSYSPGALTSLSP
ncbi:hypothetical protein ACX80E_01680 [Arthrobacter sp. TMN-49]